MGGISTPFLTCRRITPSPTYTYMTNTKAVKKKATTFHFIPYRLKYTHSGLIVSYIYIGGTLLIGG